jgi:hypothetical protein
MVPFPFGDFWDVASPLGYLWDQAILGVFA